MMNGLLRKTNLMSTKASLDIPPTVPEDEGVPPTVSTSSTHPSPTGTLPRKKSHVPTATTHGSDSEAGTYGPRRLSNLSIKKHSEEVILDQASGSSSSPLSRGRAPPPTVGHRSSTDRGVSSSTSTSSLTLRKSSSKNRITEIGESGSSLLYSASEDGEDDLGYHAIGGRGSAANAFTRVKNINKAVTRGHVQSGKGYPTSTPSMSRVASFNSKSPYLVKKERTSEFEYE